MPHRPIFRSLSMQVANELPGFAKHFYAIFLANQMSDVSCGNLPVSGTYKFATQKRVVTACFECSLQV